ncbi:hypothetical protein [Halopiger goleimassiliensis]|uniref:hypothetical protein n=1 Tax=Halopiger goleimassiliensis TaxID=1293048 RepID=UPI0006780DB4|nr:hypothetical protein [Halopiger goleimassiliensis]
MTERRYPLAEYPVVEAYLRAFCSVLVAFVLTILSAVTAVTVPDGRGVGVVLVLVAAIALCYAPITVRRTKVSLVRGRRREEDQ